MLIADAATTANQYVWQETISGLSVGSRYTFSGYVASTNPSLISPAVIELAVGGTQIGNTTTATGPAGTIDLFSAPWTATSTSAAFQIYDTNLQGPYNDFALDDISLTTPNATPAVPEPAPLAMLGLGLLPVGFVVARRKIAP